MLPRRGATKSEPLTWGRLLEVGLVELDLHPHEFYEYDMNELVVKVEGVRKRREQQQIEDWRHTRAICYTASLPYMKRKVTQEKYWPLPGDKEYKQRRRISEMNEHERALALQKIRERLTGFVNNN